MKIVKYTILLLFAVVGLGASALWAANNIGNTSYTCVDTSVTSATVPTSVFSPGRYTTWFVHAEASPASDPVRIFFYTGSTPPTAVPSPSAYMERPSGSDWWDQITCDQPSCNDAIGQGIGAYLASGSTATTIDVCGR
jgi:hypothetical protein